MPSPVDYYKYARAYLHHGKHEQALQCLQLAIAHLVKLEGSSKSSTTLTQARELKAKAIFTLGHVYSAMKQHDASGAWYLAAGRTCECPKLRHAAFTNARLCFSRENDVHKLLPLLNDPARTRMFTQAIARELDAFTTTVKSVAEKKLPAMVLAVGNLSWWLGVHAALCGAEVVAVVSSQMLISVAQVLKQP
jgi:tetratricopeptide (TPR) repeat protein